MPDTQERGACHCDKPLLVRFLITNKSSLILLCNHYAYPALFPTVVLLQVRILVHNCLWEWEQLVLALLETYLETFVLSLA